MSPDGPSDAGDHPELDPALPAYLRRLPFGERLPVPEAVTGSDLWPFEGELRTRPLQRPLLPEPLRRGQPGAAPCDACTHGDEGAIWRDEGWRVYASPGQRSGLPAVLVLMPVAHHDLEDLAPELTAELGPMIQRVARAIGRLDAVGRVHVLRWGDGSEHFHVWLLARPLGMWQLRGAMLAVWDDILPEVPADERAASLRAIAASLAEEGGRALI